MVPALVAPAVPAETVRLPPLTVIWALLVMPTPLVSAPKPVISPLLTIGPPLPADVRRRACRRPR